MKYESWLKKDQQHKYNLIKNLNGKRYTNFIKQFFQNKIQTEYILFKKLNTLFDLNSLKLYSIRELIKLHKITFYSKFSLDTIILLFNKFNYLNITEYNVDKLVLYLNNIDNVGWGPGNHKNISDNINNHFTKHVLSNEQKHWVKILEKINNKSYEKYAIDSFYKMKKVIIHTNGVDVHLSGFYNNIFIIGRYEKENFGISSCYYVENGEKLGRYKGVCLKL